MKKKVLYITYDGLTDPLGASQITPYLIGLAALGHQITILSFEKKVPYRTLGPEVKFRLDQNQIAWIPLSYTKWPPIFSTIWDIFRMNFQVRAFAQTGKRFDWVHCRSYIAAFAGMAAQNKYGWRFIFDMRGFWADERIESGLWPMKHPVYQQIYRYFKHCEKVWLQKASAVVTLTEAAVPEVVKWVPNVAGKIHVVPCMVDDTLFSIQATDIKPINWRQTLQIDADTLVVGYLGSVSTWYLPDEMISFFNYLQTKVPTNSVFIWVTPEVDFIKKLLAKRGDSLNHHRFITVPRTDVPSVCQIFDLALSFIKPTYSKIASSPVKMGELMALGVPIVCNPVGDIASLHQTHPDAFYVISTFTEASYEVIVQQYLKAPLAKDTIQKAALQHFALPLGVQRYHTIYESI